MCCGARVDMRIIDEKCLCMVCGVCRLAAMVMCPGSMGYGLTRSWYCCSMGSVVCWVGLFFVQRKQGRVVSVWVDRSAVVDFIRFGLYWTVIVVVFVVRFRVWMWLRSLWFRAASGHCLSWFWKKVCMVCSSMGCRRWVLSCCLAFISMVRSRSLYRLLAFVFSWLRAASEFPSQRRQRYSSSYILPMGWFRENISPSA